MSVKRSSTIGFSGLRGRNGTSVALATSDLNAVGLAIVLALVAALSGTRRGLLVPGLRISEVLASAQFCISSFMEDLGWCAAQSRRGLSVTHW